MAAFAWFEAGFVVGLVVGAFVVYRAVKGKLRDIAKMGRG
jgi:uncharacterized protein YneF (UPF0154 family)